MDEFIEMMKKYKYSGVGEIQYAFDEFAGKDTEKDEQNQIITKKSLQAIFEANNVDMSDDDIDLLMKDMDQDEDGEINLEDFVKSLMQI